MTDDIFDYFSGNSNRKVEPIDDEDDQVESSIDPVPSDITETEIDDDPLPVANEVDEKVSHWDRLLGKLGISPSAKTTAPPKSVQLPAVSAEEKAARASKRKEQAKARGQEVQPFGGIAAPPGSKPMVEPEAPQIVEAPRAESASRTSTEAKKSSIKKKAKPASAPSKFGMGILDEISTEVPERVTPHGTETLADLFVASEQFEPPFEEARREIDDLEPFPADDREPHSAQLDKAPEQTSEIDDDNEEDDDEAEFIEYEVQDLDFADSDEERPRRPSRRDRARRGRTKPEFEDPGTQSGGRGRHDQAVENKPKPQTPSRRGRNTRDQDDEDLGFEKEEPTSEEADSTPTRGRRRSRGRARGRGSRDSRPPRDAVDRVEIDDVEIDESLEIAEREEFDDREEGRDRDRGRKPRGASRRSRQENRVRDDDDIDDGSFGVYDDDDDDEPKTARGSGRRRQTGDKDMEFDPGKRPQIPTWSEAVASMVELNIKARGSKPSGSGRGRGPRRPRRR